VLAEEERARVPVPSVWEQASEAESVTPLGPAERQPSFELQLEWTVQAQAVLVSWSSVSSATAEPLARRPLVFAASGFPWELPCAVFPLAQALAMRTARSTSNSLWEAMGAAVQMMRRAQKEQAERALAAVQLQQALQEPATQSVAAPRAALCISGSGFFSPPRHRGGETFLRN
jgi:hypothetical protein